MTRPRIIDAWVQPWTPEIVKAFPDKVLHVARQYKQDRLVDGLPLQALADELEAAGVDLALVSGGPVIPMDPVLEVLDRWPDRFRGVAWADPTAGIVKALADLEHLVKNHPIVAFKLEPFLLRLDPTDRVFYPVYAKCAELGIALQTQVGGTGPLYPSRTGLPLHIDEIALDFPELRIVCGHVGSPWVDEMIHVAFKHPNVWIDTSARLPKLFEPQFVKYLSTYGQDKCIFATDWPLLDVASTLAQVDQLELRPEVKEKFLVSNAVRAFALDI